MERTAEMPTTAAAPTRELAEFCAGVRFENLPAAVVRVAKSCVLDWLGVTLAGSGEPLVEMLAAEIAEQGAAAQATLIGRGGKVSAVQASLVNGAAGHALDFDDVLRAFRGHPTAATLPAALALAEMRGAGGKALLTAFATGVEVGARVGTMMGDAHYARGFHATGTNGTFAAAAACANLLGLDAAATATAFGIAGTQAAGLKSMFGTMCKPLHAGKAAQNGLFAAKLAARGFTARPDVLECAQGNGETQTDGFDAAAGLEALGERWHVPDMLFKYHPACYGTHAPIGAAQRIAANPAYAADKVERIELRVDERCMRMCNIPSPVTGLEGKFSLRYNVGLALAGKASGALASYEDAAMGDPDVMRLRDRVRVEGLAGFGATEAELIVHLADGLVLRERDNVDTPDRDLDRQWGKLAGKFTALAEPVLGKEGAAALLDAVAGLESARDLSAIARLATAR